MRRRSAVSGVIYSGPLLLLFTSSPAAPYFTASCTLSNIYLMINLKQAYWDAANCPYGVDKCMSTRHCFLYMKDIQDSTLSTSMPAARCCTYDRATKNMYGTTVQFIYIRYKFKYLRTNPHRL